jgi:hypothetical protein
LFRKRVHIGQLPGYAQPEFVPAERTTNGVPACADDGHGIVDSEH